MRRSISAGVLGAVTSLAIAGVALAQPISEPASCSGYLAACANPNNGWIIQNLIRPAAEDLGTTVGGITVTSAMSHEGGLEACIPDL